MKSFRFASVVLTVLSIGLLIGCSAKESEQTQTATKEQSTTQKQSTAARTIENAQNVVASLSNPKEGFDPVCYMAIDENAVVITYNEQKYGFCSQNCADKFQENPAMYINVGDRTNNTKPDHDHDHDH